jgi:hypothetical protein
MAAAQHELQKNNPLNQLFKQSSRNSVPYFTTANIAASSSHQRH